MEATRFNQLKEIMQHHPVQQAYLFGSHAHGTAEPLLAHRAVLRGLPLLKHVPHDTAVLKTKILHAYEDTRHLREIKEAVFI